MGRRKKVWDKEQLKILHECWKISKTRQECLKLIAEKLPKIPPPVAWSLIRKMSHSDNEWKVTAKQKERERKEQKLLKERTRQIKMKRRDEKQRTKEWKNQRENIQKKLTDDNLEQVSDIVGTDFFFCPEIHQYVCPVSCIFRVFSNNEQYNGSCEKCDRLNEHIPALEKIIEGEKDEGQRHKRNKTSQRSKDK